MRIRSVRVVHYSRSTANGANGGVGAVVQYSSAAVLVSPSYSIIYYLAIDRSQ